MTTTVIALTLIVGTLAFAAGAFFAAEIATRILRRRERQISEERKTLNAAWKYLREVYGVRKPGEKTRR
jgi:cell division protein FtsL